MTTKGYVCCGDGEEGERRLLTLLLIFWNCIAFVIQMSEIIYIDSTGNDVSFLVFPNILDFVSSTDPSSILIISSSLPPG